MKAGKRCFSTIILRRDFLAAARGAKWIAPTLILQMTKRPPDHPAGPEARIGYTVTKKMGNAVVRNRIKRRLREAARKLPAELLTAGQDYVIISRAKAASCEFSELVRDMQFAFSRITANKVLSQ